MYFQYSIKSISILSIAISTVIGCAANDVKIQPVSKEMVAYPLAPPEIGQKRVSKDLDGTITTAELVSIENDLFSWVTTDNHEWTNYPNPILPSPTFSGEKWGSGTQELTNVKGALFPLKVGNKMSFTVNGTSTKYPSGWKQRRNCKVKAQERLTVVAGDFDAFKIVCTEENRIRTIYFAPEVNDIVLLRNKHKTDSSRNQGWELVEFIPAN